MSMAVDQGKVDQQIAFWREAAVFATTVVTGTTKGTISLRIPCAHATRVDVLIKSDQTVTAVRRYYGASGSVEVDDAGETVTGGTPKRLDPIDDLSIGQEVELLITNASGSTATVSAWMRAI